MASKKNRIKGKTVDISQFLSGGEVGMALPVIDWAAEMESQGAMLDENPVKTNKVKAEIIHTRQQLPSAPKAARGPNADIEKVPLDPPFILRISNVPFTTTDGEVARLLSVNINVEVVTVKLAKSDGGQNRGFGTVEFRNRDDLIGALNAESLKMNNREIKLSLQEQTENNSRNQQRGGSYNNASAGDPDRAEESNWRSEPIKQPSVRREADFPQRDIERSIDIPSMPRYEQPHRSAAPAGYETQPRSYGRHDYEPPRPSAGYDRYGPPDSRMGSAGRPAAPPMDYGRGAYPPSGPPVGYAPVPPQTYYEPRYGSENMYPPQMDPRYGYPSEISVPPANYPASRDRDRDRRPSYDQPPRRDGRGSGGGRDDYVGRGGPPDRDRRGSQNSRHSPVTPEPEAPKERKRLVLKPRSKPLEENQTEEDIAAAKAAVFGGAKPVDTAAREREIEEKLLQQRQDEKRKTEHQPQHTQGHSRRVSERTLSTSSSTYGPKSPRPPTNLSAADVKLAPHGGNLRSKINDGSVQLLRRSVSGNSAQDDVGSIGGDQQGLMSSSQHSSIDSQTRRDQTSEERQMTRSTGAIPNGTHKPPAANPWTNRSKGGESVEYEELSQDKTLSNDHEGEEEEFSEGQEDFKNPIIDGTGRPVDNNPDEDGFRGAQAIRRGTSGGHRGYREYRRGGGLSQPSNRGPRGRGGRNAGVDRGSFRGPRRGSHEGDDREAAVRKSSGDGYVEQTENFDSGANHTERRSSGEHERNFASGRGIAEERPSGRGKPPVGHANKDRTDRGHPRHERQPHTGGRSDKHNKYVQAEKPPRMMKEAQLKQASAAPPVYKDVNKFAMLDELAADE